MRLSCTTTTTTTIHTQKSTHRSAPPASLSPSPRGPPHPWAPGTARKSRPPRRSAPAPSSRRGCRPVRVVLQSGTQRGHGGGCAGHRRKAPRQQPTWCPGLLRPACKADRPPTHPGCRLLPGCAGWQPTGCRAAEANGQRSASECWVRGARCGVHGAWGTQKYAVRSAWATRDEPWPQHLAAEVCALHAAGCWRSQHSVPAWRSRSSGCTDP